MHQILVVGGGSIGERHVRCFQKTGRATVSLCEIRDDVRERVARTYSLPRRFSSLEEALAEPHDAVVLCTPAHLHVGMALQCTRQGKGVLIEKPLSTEERGITELLRVVEENKLPASVAYVYRAHPVLENMRGVIQSGRMGRMVQVVMTAGQHFPFYRPAYRDTYYTRHETGGGAIQDALTHMLNAAEWIAGPITKVCVDAAHQVLEGVDVEDTVHVLAQHGEILGSYALNQHQPPNETCLTIICENGAARFEAHHTRWLSCSVPDAAWTIEQTAELKRDDLFVRQANAFLDQLEGTRAAACPLSEGWQTLRVNLACLKSWNQQAWVNV